MVFVIQKAQNKDSLAIQLKLNELVTAQEHASNRLVNVERMTEDELNVIREMICHAANLPVGNASAISTRYRAIFRLFI